MVTAAQNLRGWKKSYAEFLGACRREFSFLKRLGFESEESVIPAEASVTFTRSADDSCVRISSEYVGEPWVVVTKQGRGAGLHRHIARLDAAYRKTWPTTGLKRQVRYYARFLKQHADSILPLLLKKAALPRKKSRAGAGALSFLETELGWDWGRSTEAGKATVVFVKMPVRVTIEWEGNELQAVHLHARSKSVNLDTLTAQPPVEARQRLDFYAAFLRGEGAALTAGKPSAWAKIKAR
jgi:hypothetical protein